MTTRLVLRVKDPEQSTRFYGGVLGCDVMVFDAGRARAELPGLTLDLVRTAAEDVERLHGAGAGRHRPGVGVEILVETADPPSIAERVRSRGGFLVAAGPTATSVRDADGYLITFARPA